MQGGYVNIGGRKDYDDGDDDDNDLLLITLYSMVIPSVWLITCIVNIKKNYKYQV